MTVTPKLGTGCSSLTLLWSGQWATLDDPWHCDLPLLNDYLPYRTPQGLYEIRGASPNLWFAVALALGFRILSIRFPKGPFVELCGIVFPGASILAATPRQCPAPLGWRVRDVGLSHCEAGGGHHSWRLVVWYPLTQLAPLPAPLVPLPWFPICSSVMDWLATTPVRANLAQADALPVAAVVRLMAYRVNGGRDLVIRTVHQWGLFPSSELSTPVLHSAVGSITGLGFCLLSWLELAALWDVPILISDRLSEASGVELLRGFCLSAPAKVLFVGADALLTTLFRGGSTFTFLQVWLQMPHQGRPPRRMQSWAWWGRALP